MVVDIDTAIIDQEIGLPSVEFELEVLTNKGEVINAAVIASKTLPKVYLNEMKTVPLLEFLRSHYVESTNISMLKVSVVR